MRKPNHALLNLSDPELGLRLHQSLRPDTRHGAPAEFHDGPSLAEARRWVRQLDRLAHSAQAPHRRLNRAWLNYQQNVDQDLMRWVRTCGIGAVHAANVLRVEIECLSPAQAAESRATPTAGRVGRLAWAHAACSIRAEAAVCAESAARAIGPHLAAASHAGQVAQPGRGDDGLRVAGRYLAEELTDTSHYARVIFSEMSKHPAFHTWRPVADPLYQQWLDGTLRHTAAPPRLYGSRTALYQARPQLAAGWTLFTGGEHTVDNLPLGSLERYVHDDGGQRWAIIIAVPGWAGGDPRGWPEPSAAVVAAHVPRGASDAYCYLLAEEIVPGDVLERLHHTPGPMALEAIAAALAPGV
ncbi:hypothetical protein J7I98_37970 [Streptomyces sp. ISL-98]|uniref:hypothetical protein n=1 Tax=Streptomyces sp. ISL-98 TaxID=2819192 RepID=UPI001BEBA952|nr:hypothetical protein [Streptomyces sp. ISL-98]MBT2511485.1 hypothetical protein [Streptomyces sp. ISL-98]